jgi:hypothetical protein
LNHWLVALGLGLGLFVLFLIIGAVVIWALMPPRAGMDPNILVPYVRIAIVFGGLLVAFGAILLKHIRH